MIKLNKVWITNLLKILQPQTNIKQMPVYGFMKNILRGIIPYCVYADKWPQYTTLVAKPGHNLCQTSPVYRLGIYSEDTSQLEEMLCHRHFLPSDRSLMMTGLAVDCIPAVECASEVLGLNLSVMGKEDHRHMFIMPPHGVINHSPLPADVYFTKLDPDLHMAAIVAPWKAYNWSDFYQTDNEGTAATQYHLTHMGPSSGICRVSDGALLSWMFSDIDTSGLMGISLPECKNSQISVCRQEAFLRQKFALGDFYWGYVAASNVKGRKLVMKAGGDMRIYSDVGFVNCIMRPRTV